MRRTLVTAVLYTLITTVLFGLGYPWLVTATAQMLFNKQANGQLIQRDGIKVGSAIIGQPFAGAEYFHSRPSAAGTGYDAANSSGSNLGPTNKQLITRIDAAVQEVQAEHPGQPVPIDLVTTSASGLDPHISPAAAEWQVDRISKAREIPAEQIRALIRAHTQSRQWGILGEPRVNVLELNLDLDSSR